MNSIFTVLLLIIALISNGVQTKSKAKVRAESDSSESSFPADFKWGAASAAYQIEGAWNVDGKGPSIWDKLVHEEPWLVEGDIKTADVAADSYHLYQKDVDALVNLGANIYRFSISFPRILPNGTLPYINEKGIEYYNKLIDVLLENNIEPMVTLYHWDLPVNFQESFGGMTNVAVVDYFVSYARLVFQRFAHKVKYWITINEPFSQCVQGYGDGYMAPGIDAPGVGIYLCGKIMLLAHAKVYRMYETEFKPKYNGIVGMAQSANYFIPKTDSEKDIAAADRIQQFVVGWFTHPTCSKKGGYPQVMIDTLAAKSKAEGREFSRLPPLSPHEIALIRGTCDFIGVNHYSSGLIEDGADDQYPIPFVRDVNVTTSTDPNWKSSASSWLYVVPEGMRGILNWLSKEYDNPAMYITENGLSNRGGIHDDDRIDYISGYLSEALKAINDGCNLKGYIHWSIMDNFEWLSGYTERFGLYEVDFHSEDKERVPKDSVNYYKEIIATGTIPAKPESRKLKNRKNPEQKGKKNTKKKQKHNKKKHN